MPNEYADHMDELVLRLASELKDESAWDIAHAAAALIAFHLRNVKNRNSVLIELTAFIQNIWVCNERGPLQ